MRLRSDNITSLSSETSELPGATKITVDHNMPRKENVLGERSDKSKKSSEISDVNYEDFQECNDNGGNDMEVKNLQLEVEYLKALLNETRSKNEILVECNKLLNEKIGYLEKNQIKPDNKGKQNMESRNRNVRTFESGTIVVGDSSLMGVADKTHAEQDQRNSEIRASLSKLSVSNVNKTIMKTSSANEITENDFSQENVHEWKEVKYKKKINESKRNNKLIISNGTKTESDSKIQGATRRRWLYVGRIAGNNTTEKDILDYMVGLNDHDTIVVKKLPTKGSNSAFSIGFPGETSFNTAFSGDFWPQRIVVREFNFGNYFRKNLKKDQPK